MSSEGSVMLVGLPGSGKTTFLAALWHQVESEEIQTVFTATKLQPDREYLNRIREKWLEFEDIPDIVAGVERSGTLHLRHSRTSAEFVLTLPNIPGEEFLAQWRERRLTRRSADILRTSLGVFLFIHCGQEVGRRELIAAGGNVSDAARSAAEWDMSFAPRQVQLVSLLQTAFDFAQVDIVRVAFILSAWDEVTDSFSPASWLARSMPLLDQFRQANTARCRSEVFGVSAIGGKLADRDQLAQLSSPSNRVRVQRGSELLRDLTVPLEFITTEPD